MKNYRFSPEALEESQAAGRWYVDQFAIKAAESFTDAVEEAVNHARRRPRAGRLAEEGCRSMEVRGFPYRVIYRDLNEEILIIAIAHKHRRPGYWLNRIK